MNLCGDRQDQKNGSSDAIQNAGNYNFIKFIRYFELMHHFAVQKQNIAHSYFGQVIVSTMLAVTKWLLLHR